MALICSGDHRCSSRSCTQPRSRWFPASFAVFGRRARNPACACAATARQPRWLLFRPISRLTVDAAHPSRAAITRSGTPAATPTAISSRSATDRYRPPGGPGGPFPLPPPRPPAPASPAPAGRSTPAATAASRTPSPARIPSKKASRATRGTGNRPRLFTTTSTISRNRCDDQLNPPSQSTTIMKDPLSAADERHLGGGDRHELDVGVQGQARHVQHRVGDVLSVEGRLRRDRSVGLRYAAADDLGHVRRGVADVDLAARDVEVPAVE